MNRIFFVDGCDLAHVLLVKLEVTLEVLLDPLRRLALRNDRLSSGNTPCQGDLGTGFVVLLADLDQYRVLDQLADLVSVDGVLVTEWGVAGDVN